MYRASSTFESILLLAGPAESCWDWCHGPPARSLLAQFPLTAKIHPAEVLVLFIPTSCRIHSEANVSYILTDTECGTINTFERI